MSAEAAFGDNCVELVETDLTSVVALQRTARHEAAVMHRDNQGVEQLLVAAIERDVDKNPIVVAGHSSIARGGRR